MGAAVMSGQTWASGFALLEQSASRLGNAFAGTTVATEDASAMFYNPASLSTLDRRQIVVSATGVSISSEFQNRNSQPAAGQPLGTEGGDAGDWNGVPSAYFAMPINERLAFGFGFNVPFGLKLEYPDDWIGRFQALNSEIQTYNFNPALSWEMNDVVTIGVGLNYQRVQAELTNAVNYTAVVGAGLEQLVLAGQLAPRAVPPLLAANAGLQATTRVRGDDDAWGYNFGVTFQVSPSTRLGLAYRSAIEYEVEGTVRFDPPNATNPTGAAIIANVLAPGGRFANGPASVDLELPDIATASLSQRIGDRFELLADIAWTGWSSVQELTVVRANGTELSTTPERWDDTWRFALGVSYELNPSLKLRAGVAYDETPVPDETRTARLPDPDRTWMAIGVRWDSGDAIVIDAGYAHLFSDDVPLDQDQESIPAFGLLNGEQNSAVDIVGVQMSYRF
jgi:long-chain fatty acid transport protein